MFNRPLRRRVVRVVSRRVVRGGREVAKRRRAGCTRRKWARRVGF